MMPPCWYHNHYYPFEYKSRVSSHWWQIHLSLLSPGVPSWLWHHDGSRTLVALSYESHGTGRDYCTQWNASEKEILKRKHCAMNERFRIRGQRVAWGVWDGGFFRSRVLGLSLCRGHISAEAWVVKRIQPNVALERRGFLVEGTKR